MVLAKVRDRAAYAVSSKKFRNSSQWRATFLLKIDDLRQPLIPLRDAVPFSCPLSLRASAVCGDGVGVGASSRPTSAAVRRREMRIPHRHPQAAMAEELGHGSKRRALHDQPRGEGVP